MEFQLIGYGFDNIPMNAVAVASVDNDDPLNLRYTESPWNILDIVEKTNNLMLFRARSSATFGGPHYLGAILTEDRRNVIFVNNSKPLP